MAKPKLLKDKHAVVMGLGRFGGGMGVTRYLLDQGATVTLTDKASQEELAQPLAGLGNRRRLKLALGGHDTTILDDADMLVVNPAVPRPWDNPFIRAAQDRGAEITTEIEIAYRLLDPQRVVAITGSSGKSTTSAMTVEALTTFDLEGAILGGNIGGSLLDQLREIRRGPDIVLELSSAMIHWLWGDHRPDPPPAPKVACVTNFSPNHLDWHGDEDHYRASKRRLLEILPPTSTAVLGQSVADWADCTKAQVRIVRNAEAINGLTVPGRHNAYNAACAHACAMALLPDADPEWLADSICAFEGLPHRLNLCHETGDIRFYNDSKCTTPGATLLAVEALSDQYRPNQIHLIAGGYDKGSDLTPIAALAPSLAGLYTIGATGPALAAAAASNAHPCKTLEAAMKTVLDRVKPGDAVLLSPACASWDQFTNYELRGRHFTQLARERTGATTW